MAWPWSSARVSRVGACAPVSGNSPHMSSGRSKNTHTDTEASASGGGPSSSGAQASSRCVLTSFTTSSFDMPQVGYSTFTASWYFARARSNADFVSGRRSTPCTISPRAASAERASSNGPTSWPLWQTKPSALEQRLRALDATSSRAAAPISEEARRRPYGGAASATRRRASGREVARSKAMLQRFSASCVCSCSLKTLALDGPTAEGPKASSLGTGSMMRARGLPKAA
mmetsp:Transcript_39624/g.110015  ORF Transcript_39624/g.110015 Transcript_39624/m.110015 type:complete len:229 (+) Transcript_39624:162-848(+)